MPPLALAVMLPEEPVQTVSAETVAAKAVEVEKAAARESTPLISAIVLEPADQSYQRYFERQQQEAKDDSDPTGSRS